MPDSLAVDARSVLGFVLVLCRMGAAFAFVNIPGARSAAAPAKVFLVLFLTVSLAPLWPRPAEANPSAGVMLGWLATEALVGLSLGLVAGFVGELLVCGAQMLGVQAGYGYASTIDPNTEADSAVLQLLAQLMANLLFFACGLDHLVLRALAESLRVWPPGTMPVTWTAATELVRLFSAILTLSVQLALPLAGLLLLVDLTLAMLGRIHSQLQLLSVAFPVKMLASLTVLAALMPVFGRVYERAANMMFRFTAAWMGA
jgi:flagellar biosynthetic protein FliR